MVLEYQEITDYQGPVPLSYEETEVQRSKDLIHVMQLILGKDYHLGLLTLRLVILDSREKLNLTRTLIDKQNQQTWEDIGNKGKDMVWIFNMKNRVLFRPRGSMACRRRGMERNRARRLYPVSQGTGEQKPQVCNSRTALLDGEIPRGCEISFLLSQKSRDQMQAI